MKEVLFLILGWFLGLFGPWLTELIQKPYRKAQIRKSLFIELRELRYKLVMLAFTLTANSGTIDRSLIEWAERIIRSDKPHYDTLHIEEALNSLLKVNDQQLEVLAEFSKDKSESFKLKKYSLPFLSSQITFLYLFTPEFQRLALSIHSNLDNLNEEVDAYRFNYEKTFDSSLSNNSRAAVHLNLKNTTQHIVIICRQIADRIDLILQRKK